MTVFIPDFGPKGIWISIFTSVSAFCNAGIDIIAENSLCDYALNPMVNTVTCLLIVIGGIGYIVWWDIIRVIKNMRQNKRKIFGNLTLHSKIAIISTLLLIIVGAILVLHIISKNRSILLSVCYNQNCGVCNAAAGKSYECDCCGLSVANVYRRLSCRYSRRN